MNKITKSFHSLITETFAVLKPGKFLCIEGYKPEKGGEFNYVMSFGSNYLKACERSIATLNSLNVENEWKNLNLPGNKFGNKIPFSKNDFNIAYDEVIKSLEKSVLGENERGEAISEAYEPVIDSSGQTVKGVKFHTESKTLHLTGIQVSVKVIIPAPPKKIVNSAPLTIAKNWWKDQLQVNNWKNWKLKEGKFSTIRVEHLTFTPEETKKLGL